MDEKFKSDFIAFLEKIGKQNQIPYVENIILCDADKCVQYFDVWRKNGIPYEHGVMIYLVTKMSPYCEEARVTISPCDFVIKHYGEFKEFMP